MAASSAVPRISVWVNSAGFGLVALCTHAMRASVAANPTLIATANSRRMRSARASARARCTSWEPAGIGDILVWRFRSSQKSVQPNDTNFGIGTLGVEILEVAIDAPLAERDAAVRDQIGGDPRALGDAVVQRDNPRHLALEPFHPLGESVAQALDDLEQREVDIAELAAEHIGATALVEDALEIMQELGQAIAPEILGRQLGGGALLLVVEIAGDGMMGVVDQHHQIGDGELQLMHPQPPPLVAGGKPEPSAEIEQDVRGLADEEFAGAQERRCERR